MTPSTKQFQSEKRPFSLGTVWQEQMSSRHGWQKKLTQKECGQLKMLANALGPRTREVIGWAIENWSDFSYRARVAAGVGSFPAEPHIGFLLAHCDIAVNQMQKIATIREKRSEVHEMHRHEKVALAAQLAEKASILATQNEEDIADMNARFAAANEPMPPITYNSLGQVAYRPTKKELAKMMDIGL